MQFLTGIIITAGQIYLQERSNDQERQDRNDAATREYTLAQQAQKTRDMIIKGVVGAGVLFGGIYLFNRSRAA